MRIVSSKLLVFRMSGWNADGQETWHLLWRNIPANFTSLMYNDPNFDNNITGENSIQSITAYAGSALAQVHLTPLPVLSYTPAKGRIHKAPLENCRVKSASFRVSKLILKAEPEVHVANGKTAQWWSWFKHAKAMEARCCWPEGHDFIRMQHIITIITAYSRHVANATQIALCHDSVL